MKIETDTIITIEGKEYAVIDKILYEGKDYILTNKFENDEPTEIYIAYELINNDEVVEIKNKKVLERIAAIFSKNVQKKIDALKIQQMYEID